MTSPLIGFIYDYTGSYKPAYIIGAVVTIGVICLTHFSFQTSKKLIWR